MILKWMNLKYSNNHCIECCILPFELEASSFVRFLFFIIKEFITIHIFINTFIYIIFFFSLTFIYAIIFFSLTISCSRNLRLIAHGRIISIVVLLVFIYIILLRFCFWISETHLKSKLWLFLICSYRFIGISDLIFTLWMSMKFKIENDVLPIMLLLITPFPLY